MSQDQLDRIEEKLDRIIDDLERPITVEHTQELIQDIPTITAEKLEEIMADFKGRICNVKVNFGGGDYDKINEEIEYSKGESSTTKGKTYRDLPQVEPAQRQLVKQTKTPFSLIKRVEYFTNAHLDMKSNRIVEYYLFDFLLYRKVYQEKDSKILFPEEE